MKEIPIYHAFAWMAVTVLSEMSVARGGAVMDLPDFTAGRRHLERKGSK